MENSGKNIAYGGLNLRATELRLGLPGSESPERENGRSLVSGAKRGFSVAIHGGSANWVFSNGAGSRAPSSANSGKWVNGSRPESGVKELKSQENKNQVGGVNGNRVASASKAQVVGWPPIRSFRKNTMASNSPKNNDNAAQAKLGSECLYVKVSMDGAPYLRKVDLKTYGSYTQLSSALGKIFGGFTISECGSDGFEDLLNGSEYVLTYEDKDGDWMLVGDVPWKMFTHSCKRLRIMRSSETTGLAPRAMEKCKGCK